MRCFQTWSATWKTANSTRTCCKKGSEGAGKYSSKLLLSDSTFSSKQMAANYSSIYASSWTDDRTVNLMLYDEYEVMRSHWSITMIYLAYIETKKEMQEKKFFETKKTLISHQEYWLSIGLSCKSNNTENGAPLRIRAPSSYARAYSAHDHLYLWQLNKWLSTSIATFKPDSEYNDCRTLPSPYGLHFCFSDDQVNNHEPMQSKIAM